MKNILLPTDFSQTAHNAYLYARDMADYIGARLKVINVSYPNKNTIEGMVPSVQDLIAYKQKQLNSFVEEGEKASVENLVDTEMVEKEVIVGFPREEIKKLSSSKDVDMILMGTTGKGGMLNKLIGSTSSEIAQKAHCPVWLIPPNASFDGIKNILYAGNYKSANGKMLQDISELASNFNANVHMIHVTKEKTFEANQIQEVVLERLFKKVAPDLDFKMGTVISQKIWEGLDYYAKENDIDLIVIVTQQRNFWENLKHKSLTKEMVFHTKTPLLIMHLDK